MDDDLVELAALFDREDGVSVNPDQACLDDLEVVGAAIRTGAPAPAVPDLAHRQDLVARAVARLDAGAVDAALRQVAASRAAARDGDDEAGERWHDAAFEVVDARESFERVTLALASIRPRDEALQRELDRLRAELAAVDRVAAPQAGGLTIANPHRRALSAAVRAGTPPVAAWWLGPRSSCPDGVAAGRVLTDAELDHVESCEGCRDDQQRAVLLDELGGGAGGRIHRPSDPLHVKNCAECTVLAEALRNAIAIATLHDELDDLQDRLSGRSAPPAWRDEIERRFDAAQAASFTVEGELDGRACHARVVSIPDGPVGPDTELSIVVQDAPRSVRGRPVRLIWKDGGTLAAGRFVRDTEALVELTPEMTARLSGATLRSELLAVALRVEFDPA